MSARALLHVPAMVLLLTSTTHAFVLRTSEAGKVLLWSQRTVQVLANQSASPALQGALEAMRAGFAVWSAAGLPINVEIRPSDQLRTDRGDHRNVIGWQHAEWAYGPEVVAMTLSLYKASSGELNEADILLNARDVQWSTSSVPRPGTYDLQSVMAHEAGHFLGLAHEPKVADATMFPVTPPGDVSKRDLASDDEHAVAALLGKYEAAGAVPGAKSAEAKPAMGCELGGRPGAGGGAALLAILLPCLAFLLGRRALLLAAAAVCLIPNVAAHASTVRELSAPQLANRAEVVLQGRVVGQRCYVQQGFVLTDYYLSVGSCLKGSCGPSMTLTVPGGEVGDQGMIAEGMPKMKSGDAVLVFGYQPAGPANLISVGLAQGVFHLIGRQAVRDLRGLHLLGTGHTSAGRLESVPIEQLYREIAPELAGRSR